MEEYKEDENKKEINTEEIENNNERNSTNKNEEAIEDQLELKNENQKRNNSELKNDLIKVDPNEEYSKKEIKENNQENKDLCQNNQKLEEGNKDLEEDKIKKNATEKMEVNLDNIISDKEIKKEIKEQIMTKEVNQINQPEKKLEKNKDTDTNILEEKNENEENRKNECELNKNDEKKSVNLLNQKNYSENSLEKTLKNENENNFEKNEDNAIMEKKSEIVDTKIDKNQIKINVNNLENNIQKNKEAKGVNSEKISKKEQDKKSNGNHRKMDANKILEKMNQDEEKKLRNRRATINISNMNIGNKYNINEENDKTIPKKLDSRRFSIFFQKEKEEKPKIIPKKINKNKLKIMEKDGNEKEVPKEIKEIKKIDTKEYLNKMISDQIKRPTQDEIPQNPPNKLKIDEILEKMKATTKKITVIRKPPKPINHQELLKIMIKNEKEKFENKKCTNENITERRSSVSEFVSNINEKEKLEEERKKIEELRKKRLEERKKIEEEKRKERDEKRKKEEEERMKKEKEERIKREKEEEERRQKEKEERIKREKEEEERRKKEEEEMIRLVFERRKEEEEERKRIEEERRKWEEEERIRKEEEKKLKEEERKKRAEERKKREEEERIRREKEEEERKKREEQWKKEMEERRKKEEEERKKREEEERKKREEEERKEKEELEKLLVEYLFEKNLKRENFTEIELERIKAEIKFKKEIDEYLKITSRDYDGVYEGKNIKFEFQEIKQISTEKINNLEITNKGKIIVSTSQGVVSNIIIYEENTYVEENRIVLDSEVTSFVIDNKYIYCSLAENYNNILIIPMDDTDKQFYLNEHSCSVSGVALTHYGKLISADINGKIIVWNDFKVYKTINDFKKRINTISEINEMQQKIAILSFYSETVKFYDLRYSEMKPLTSISNIKGSGFQNNMLKLNNNILAIAGTYIYIIDLNSFIVTNTISCVFANDAISTSLILEDDESVKGFFFVGQALTNSFTDDKEKGTIGYYEYDFNNRVIPDDNPLYKIGSKVHAHDHFITSIRSINFETFVTGSMDGKIKFWKIVEI